MGVEETLIVNCHKSFPYDYQHHIVPWFHVWPDTAHFPDNNIGDVGAKALAGVLVRHRLLSIINVASKRPKAYSHLCSLFVLILVKITTLEKKAWEISQECLRGSLC